MQGGGDQGELNVVSGKLKLVDILRQGGWQYTGGYGNATQRVPYQIPRTFPVIHNMRRWSTQKIWSPGGETSSKWVGISWREEIRRHQLSISACTAGVGVGGGGGGTKRVL